jgi:L-ribulose-5-phosphate 3-epimerase
MPIAGGQVLQQPAGRQAVPAQPSPRLKRAIHASMLPGNSWKARFAVAAAAGFEGVAIDAVEAPTEADEIARAAADSRLTIGTVTCPATAQFPLSSADPEVVKKGVLALKTALTVASMWRAEDVIITPAVIDESTPPSAGWSRSQAVLGQQILPLAGGFRLHVAIKVPTEKFLLSSADCNRYIDELRSPWIKASLRVSEAFGAGVVGTPQDWIRTMARRLSGLRLDDRHLNRAAGTVERRNLGDGDVDWQAVRKAMSEAPYITWVTADLDPGDAAYIANLRVRIDKFLAGFRPGSGPGA